MKVIVFCQPDNTVSVIYPAMEYADQVVAVAQKDVPSGRPWRVIDENDLPPRDTRDRWRWTGSGALNIATKTDFVK